MSTEETFVHYSEYSNFLNELKLTKEFILTYLLALLFYQDFMVFIDKTCIFCCSYCYWYIIEKCESWNWIIQSICSTQLFLVLGIGGEMSVRFIVGTVTVIHIIIEWSKMHEFDCLILISFGKRWKKHSFIWVKLHPCGFSSWFSPKPSQSSILQEVLRWKSKRILKSHKSKGYSKVMLGRSQDE